MKERIAGLIQYGKGIKKLYDDCHIAAYSGGAAFFVLVSAVPLAVFGVVLLGYLAPFDVIGLGEMLRQLFAENASGRLAGLMAEITEHSAVPLLSVTMAFLLWAATRGIRSIADGIDAIYRCRERYNIVQLTVRSVFCAVAIITVAVLSLAVPVLTAPFEAAVRRLLGGGGEVVLVLLNMRGIIFFAALTLLFATAYRSLAKSDLTFKNQLYGAAFAAAGWIGYSFGYSVYIRCFSRYSVLYGSFGAVMLFLLWLYMCMNILLCGALINRIRADGWKV